MTNPIKGEVPLKLSDGRQFTLVADFEALVEAEAAYGKPLPVLGAEMAQGFLGASRAMLYGLLRAKQPGISMREVGAMLLSDPDAVREAIDEASDKGFPDASGKPEGKKSGNPPGKSSGGNGAKPD